MLGLCGATLREFEIGLLAAIPGSPSWQTPRIRIARLRKVSPVSLDDRGEFVIRFGKGQPAPTANGECTEDIGYFQTMKCAQFRFSPAWNGAIELIQKGPPARSLDKGDFRTSGTRHQDVVAGVVDGDIAMH